MTVISIVSGVVVNRVCDARVYVQGCANYLDARMNYMNDLVHGKEQGELPAAMTNIWWANVNVASFTTNYPTSDEVQALIERIEAEESAKESEQTSQ